MFKLKLLVYLCLISVCTSCGGGGGGGGGSKTPAAVIALIPGSPALDNSDINNGVLHITFPNAVGDQPRITALDANGSNGNGITDLSICSSNSFDITSDNCDVYFPTAGNYALTLSISDAGDTPQQLMINVSIPNSNAYSLSGHVQDGPLNSTVGVRSNVRLYWNPLSYPQTQISLTQSDQADNGSYAFANLVGPASYFRIAVDSGTH